MKTINDMKATKGKYDRTTPKGKRVCVIWTRVSTKEQADNNLSLDTQEKYCRDYATRNGIEVDCVKGKTNESAKTEGKLYEEMIAYVAKNRIINTILVYSYDRFSRAGAEAIMTKAYLKSKGVSVISATQPIDGDTESGELMENMLFLFNQFENNLRKGKCTAGMIECLENGDWYSQPPLGYSKKKDSTKKHEYYINETGKLLALAFKWKATEEITDTEICRRLKAQGLNMYKQRLSEIFHNPFYCGKIKHSLLGKDEDGNDRIVQGNHPPLIDEATWKKVNGIQTHSGYTHAKEPELYPLNKHILCPECGRHLTGYTAKGLQYYKCSHKGCRLNISALELNSRYRRLLKGYGITEELTPIVEDMIKGVLKEREEYQATEEKELKSRRTKKVEEKNKVMLRFGKGEIPAEVYNVTASELNKEIGEIEQALEKVSAQKSNLENAARQATLTACKLDNMWAYGTFGNRQKIQNLVFPAGITWNRENLENLTKIENETFRLIRSLSSTFGNEKTKKEEKPFDFSSVVAEAGLEPATSGL